MSELANTSLIYLFPTPFLHHVWADSEGLNNELRDRILARERANPGISKTNIGGWHSEAGKLEWCGQAGVNLIQRMFEAANHATFQLMSNLGRPMPDFKWTLQAWANVSRAGAFNKTHTHAGATWSGTYYVDTGEPPPELEDGTPLLLMDSDQGRANTFFPSLVPMTAFIKPEPGLMVLFPSYLPHMVFAHQGKRPRISIAFNLRKEPFP